MIQACHRLHDWQLRLALVLADHHSTPFAWGTHDCVTFAARCVQAVTGADHLSGLITWSDERTALRALKDAGGMRAAVASVLGTEISPLMALPGDVGAFDEGGRDALCVWCGDAWIAPGLAGLTVVSPDRVQCAWHCEGGV